MSGLFIVAANNMDKLIIILGYISIISGIAIIITLRIVGIDLTEGQLLIRYAHYWVLSVGLVTGGINICCNTRR